MKHVIALASISGLLLACSPTQKPQSAEPVDAVAKPPPLSLALDVPAGLYRMDPNHSSLSFSVTHLGLSNYVLRFTQFAADMNLDPAQPGAASVSVTVDPTSIRSDYPGDYRGSHKNSPYASWDEDLAQSPKFLHAAEFPQISFVSRSVTVTGAQSLRIQGELTLRGQTHPLTLQAEVVGAAAAHPFSGVGAIGFSASGRFKRSDYGMSHLLDPPLVGDLVSLRFEGEFNQVVQAAK